MGNNRFRLSDMMPNAWFYKLKDMGKTRNHNTTTHSTKKKHATSAAAAAAVVLVRENHTTTLGSLSQVTKNFTPPRETQNPDTLFPDPPRRSSKQRARKRTIKSSSPKLVTSSVSSVCDCRATLWTKSNSPPDYSASLSDSSLDQETDFSDSFPPEFRSDCVLATDSFDKMLSWSSSNCDCKLDSNNCDDIVTKMDEKYIARRSDDVDVFHKISNLDLPPIITKPPRFDDQEPVKYRRSSAKYEETNANASLSVKVVKDGSIAAMKEHKTNTTVRRNSVTSPGVRLRVNSPRISNRKIQAYNNDSLSRSRRSLSDSLAVVKSSFDPQKDFRESMMEMIVENNINASKDLEDLLACYLSLNSDEYHDLIIKVFKQIWFDLSDIKLQ
ncbi:hypothetical protein NC652_037049 [Populus alba x Populus x berolinensis]|nr:hypothetical protein NC652_037049 [Populus alba x Populus x berolinensis]